MPILDKDRKARANYRKNKMVELRVPLFPKDQDIKERLEEVKQTEGKAAYIRRLIREDIERSKS